MSKKTGPDPTVWESSILGVIPGIFLEEGQRSKRFHAIEEQDPVQMVGFVLRHPRRKIAKRHLEPRAVASVAAQTDFPRTRHPAADVRNAQTAFPVLDDVVADGRDLRVYD